MVTTAVFSSRSTHGPSLAAPVGPIRPLAPNRSIAARCCGRFSRGGPGLVALATSSAGISGKPRSDVTLSRGAINDLLQRHDLAPRRALGQNFLADPNTVRKIVRLAQIDNTDSVVEIGPGLGSLTLALAETGAQITAIEADGALLGPLSEVLKGSDVTVVHADATVFDMWVPALGDGPVTMVANLPYNVGTRLVADVLDFVPAVERLVVMVQEEVGKRMMATAGSSDYGALSVKVASWATATRLCKVPSTVFVPKPRVESMVVDIRRHVEPAIPHTVDRGRVFDLVRAGFGQRRKMLRRSLAGRVSFEQFEAAEVRPDARAETLDLSDWVRLAEATEGPSGAND